MRLRPRTIRTQLTALLLVPMVSLAALWTYGSYTTLRGALSLIRVNVTDHYYGSPAEALVVALQDERRAAVEYDASDGAHGARTLARAERATDARAAVVSDHLRHRSQGIALGADQNATAHDVLSAIGQLPSLRLVVKARNTNWSDVLDQYSALIDPNFRLRSALAELQTGEVALKGSVVVGLGRARELLSQEDALVLGGRAAHGMTDGQYRDLIGTIDGRQLLHGIYDPDLPPTDATQLENFEDGQTGWSLLALEDDARAATAMTTADALPEKTWQPTVNAALAQLADIDGDASYRVDQEAHSAGMDVLRKAALVLLAGLLAVIGSLVISVRIGRRIAARLTGLRDTAEELSGRRLPEMMRRLREGDPVEDVAAIAWPHEPGGHRDEFGENLGDGIGFGGSFQERRGGFVDDEIGQVGRAFGVAQRAAVQAAVEQARLRRGVAAVFTTLARRSQVILHRQLALLDTMERRSENPEELADLFRLDHMTNRMRRQAEGLLILSGLTPGRAWRRPVRLGEVVRAAVGEVEGYERIVVHRMPARALVGSAVADVLHLFAELMENATAFSPPGTEVAVRGSEGACGFSVEIEDRGLGMNAERLAEANTSIEDAAERGPETGADVIELPDTDRLGLFTVGRLAARHGVRVTLRRSSCDGTVAVVLLPAELLADPEDGPAESDETGAHPVPGPRALRNAGAGAGRHRGPSGDTGTRTADGGAGSAPDGAGAGRPEPDAVRTPRPAVSAGRTTPAGLPRRVPSRNLAPRLREEDVAHERPTRDAASPADRERSPEAARSVAAAYARGLARGRSDSAAREREAGSAVREPDAGAADRERDPATSGGEEGPEVAAPETEGGGPRGGNAIEKIEKAAAGETTPEEDGGTVS